MKDPLCLLSSCTRRSVLNIDWALAMGESPYRKLEAEFTRLPSSCVYGMVWGNVLKIGLLPREKLKGREEELLEKRSVLLGDVSSVEFLW